MPFNPDIANRIFNGFISYYVAPKLLLRYLTKRAALNDLNQAINEKCSGRGGVSDAERTRLEGELAKKLTSPTMKDAWRQLLKSRYRDLWWQIPKFILSPSTVKSWTANW